MSSPSLRRDLRAIDAISLVVGTIVGTGIFLKTTTMSLYVGSPLLVLAAWAVAGLLSLLGALVYAELADRFPKSGGEYVYIRAAYGNLPAFLYGWQRFWIGSPGSIAAYAVGSATFLSSIFSFGNFGRGIVSVGFILFFSALNCLAVRIGGRTQTAFTLLKFFLILGLTAALFGFCANGTFSHLAEHAIGSVSGWKAFGLAVLSALWAFDGWNNLPMAAGEVKNPGRNIPLALVLGVASAFVLYALLNIAYFFALPFSAILGASSQFHPDAPAVASLAAQTVFGSAGAALFAIAMTISALGAMNGSILTSARIPFAMASDGNFPLALAKLAPRAQVPARAVMLQGLWACALALSGTFDQITDWVIFASWIFYGLCGFALIRFRQRDPHTPSQGYRAPLYPALPLLFCVMAVLLFANTVMSSPRESAFGLVFILAGVPVYGVRHLLAASRVKVKSAPGHEET
jgi:APA family basic amino acid/polyamine antiporter